MRSDLASGGSLDGPGTLALVDVARVAAQAEVVQAAVAREHQPLANQGNQARKIHQDLQGKHPLVVSVAKSTENDPSVGTPRGICIR